MKEMASKHLVLHFDGKILKHIEEESKQSTSTDRIAISVTSPEFGDRDDLLLGVVPCESGKSADCALCIQNLCEYFDVCDGIFAICGDTTAANTGRNNGTIVILAQVLQKPFLWLLCRHHISELTIKLLSSCHRRKNCWSQQKNVYRHKKRLDREVSSSAVSTRCNSTFQEN